MSKYESLLNSTLGILSVLHIDRYILLYCIHACNTDDARHSVCTAVTTPGLLYLDGVMALCKCIYDDRFLPDGIYAIRYCNPIKSHEDLVALQTMTMLTPYY